MGEVTLPCFLISLPKAIFVIARLVGPFSEKKNATEILKMLSAHCGLGRMLLKRGMGNGEWGMGNGEWEIENGK